MAEGKTKVKIKDNARRHAERKRSQKKNQNRRPVPRQRKKIQEIDHVCLKPQ